MMTYIVTALVFLLWATYRFLVPPSGWLDDYLAKPIIWLLPLLLVSPKWRFELNPSWKNLLIGLSVGLVLSIERLLFGHFTLEFSFFYILGSLVTALVEETFFRGYLLNTWLKQFRSKYLAILLNSLVFTLFHLPLAVFQLHYFGYDLFTYLVVNYFSGMVNIILFTSTGSLLTSVANHFVWNTFSSIYR